MSVAVVDTGVLGGVNAERLIDNPDDHGGFDTECRRSPLSSLDVARHIA